MTREELKARRWRALDGFDPGPALSSLRRKFAALVAGNATADDLRDIEDAIVASEAQRVSDCFACYKSLAKRLSTQLELDRLVIMRSRKHETHVTVFVAPLTLENTDKIEAAILAFAPRSVVGFHI